MRPALNLVTAASNVQGELQYRCLPPAALGAPGARQRVLAAAGRSPASCSSHGRSQVKLGIFVIPWGSTIFWDPFLRGFPSLKWLNDGGFRFLDRTQTHTNDQGLSLSKLGTTT